MNKREWLSLKPLILANPSSLLSNPGNFNSVLYVNGDPLNLVDPKGKNSQILEKIGDVFLKGYKGFDVLSNIYEVVSGNLWSEPLNNNESIIIQQMDKELLFLHKSNFNEKLLSKYESEVSKINLNFITILNTKANSEPSYNNVQPLVKNEEIK